MDKEKTTKIDEESIEHISVPLTGPDPEMNPLGAKEKGSPTLNEAHSGRPTSEAVAEIKLGKEADEKEPHIDEQKLDDARRVKVVSPGMLVAKRFFRNKLAIVGLSVLVILFLFCFIGSWAYPYTESDVFCIYKDMFYDYATANQRTSYENYFLVDKGSVDMEMQNSMTSIIVGEMIPSSLTTYSRKSSDGKTYVINKKADKLYTVSSTQYNALITLSSEIQVGKYTKDLREDEYTITLDESDAGLSSAILGVVANATSTGYPLSYGGKDYLVVKSNKTSGKIIYKPSTFDVSEIKDNNVSQDFIDNAIANVTNSSFAYEGKTYYYLESGKGYTVNSYTEELAYVSTSFVLHAFDVNNVNSINDNNFKAVIFSNLGDGSTFTYQGANYEVALDSDFDYIVKKDGTDYVAVSDFVIKRYNGQDTLTIATKKKIEGVVSDMITQNTNNSETYIDIEKVEYVAATDESEASWQQVFDEGGNAIIENTYFTVEKKTQGYVFRNEQSKYVADVFGKPSSEHILGLDGNGMDVLARVMYGGRISLMIGFIVVFIEIILGTIMGGISGYFGGFVDNLIMRIVDIFYCIPTMPILIILGAMFDSINMPNFERLVWMMAVLGFLGWPSIARLVRGQILSLREQDFMVAAEASGLKPGRKIFKHLVPNVMPQLIVQATMGLGGVIITESTLSFLGLGVKYPMATWGAIINSVSSAQDMVNYTYIWIPVGCLICLAVIAFNFVGDGLRDAFDPKMKR